MSQCEERDKLQDEYQSLEEEAKQVLGRITPGFSKEFSRLLERLEDLGNRRDQARLAVEQHRRSHGCVEHARTAIGAD